MVSYPRQVRTRFDIDMLSFISTIISQQIVSNKLLLILILTDLSLRICCKSIMGIAFVVANISVIILILAISKIKYSHSSIFNVVLAILCVVIIIASNLVEVKRRNGF